MVNQNQSSPKKAKSLLGKKFKYKGIEYEVTTDDDSKLIGEGEFVNNKKETRLVRVCWSKEHIEAIKQLLST